MDIEADVQIGDFRILKRLGAAGRTAAVLYSFTGTCKHHDIDPFEYLRDILRRMPS
jgi:hypothetical protein